MLVDLVKINISSATVGAFVLSAAVEGYRGQEVLTNGESYSYAIVQGSNYEIGRGVFLSASNQMTRSVIASSSGGTPIDLTPNAEIAFVALAADLQTPSFLYPLSGEDAPTDATGAIGQFYFKTDTPVTLYGPKSSSGWGAGAPIIGDPGPASAFRVNLATIKAAAISDKVSLYDGAIFAWTAGNFTGRADDVNIIQSDNAAISTGAWVRQTVGQLTGYNVADLNALRANSGSGSALVSVADRGASYAKLATPLPRREDQNGDYVIDQNGNAWQLNGRVSDIRPDLPTVGEVMAAAARGATVSIGIIGDSVVDGANSSPYTQNPTSGTDPDWGVIPTATNNQNTNAPNAWAAVLQQLLRDHYGNTNIRTFNGGYAGQTMSSTFYWAPHWYNKIFNLNPNYGIPTITAVAFGLNDSNTADADMVQHFLAGARAICSAIRGAGSVPVLLTPISVVNVDRSNRAWRELAPALRTWCADQGVFLVDVMDEIARYWGMNGLVKQGVSLTDFVHPYNDTHGFVAGAVMKELCSDVRRVSAMTDAMPSWHVSAGAPASNLGSSSGQTPFQDNTADSRFGAYRPTTGLASTANFSDVFVWCDHNDYEAYLRAFTPNVTGTFTSADLPSVKIQTAERYKESASILVQQTLCLGDRGTMVGFMTDVPLRLGRLRYGLNRIQLTMPATTDVTYYFEAVEFNRLLLPQRGYQANANAFVKDRMYASGVGELTSSTHLELPAESFTADQMTVASFGILGETLTVDFEVECPVNAGTTVMTGFAQDGKRQTFALVKKSDGLYSCITTQGGASETIQGLAWGGAPDILRFRAVYKTGTDLQPSCAIYYNGSLFYTFKIPYGFGFPAGGRLGGAYSLNADSPAGLVKWKATLVRTAP